MKGPKKLGKYEYCEACDSTLKIGHLKIFTVRDQN